MLAAAAAELDPARAVDLDLDQEAVLVARECLRDELAQKSGGTMRQSRNSTKTRTRWAGGGAAYPASHGILAAPT